VGEEGGKKGEAGGKMGGRGAGRIKWNPGLAGGRLLVLARPQAYPIVAWLFSIFLIFKKKN
jgi:hypothetical protein